MAAVKVQGHIEFAVTEEEFESRRVLWEKAMSQSSLIKTAQYGDVVGWE
jgi:hypothetical protein